jgi:CopG family transcriptional regulator, nickel-responsive regulator
MDGLQRFGVSMDGELLSAFDQRIEAAGYTNRSAALRDIVRDYLVEHEWQGGEGEVVGTVTLVYDHHTRELESKLIDLQHHHGPTVICSTHVHLDADHCLEVVVLRGEAEGVRELGERLIGTRGVKHGKLTCTTTGEALR